jgi:hypothetical protein
VSTLRTRICEDNPGWQVSERRLRKLRTEAQMEDVAGNPHMVESRDGQQYSTGLHTAPGQRVDNVISDDGVEYAYLVGIGARIPTGRTFKKDEGTGEWVLQ